MNQPTERGAMLHTMIAYRPQLTTAYPERERGLDLTAQWEDEDDHTIDLDQTDVPGLMAYYIIEHETKGILMELPYDRDEKAHFSWSKPRSAARTFTLPEARRLLLILPEGCYILHLGTWDRVRKDLSSP